jgi:diguanylate cyclase (GGDEF)-like protein
MRPDKEGMSSTSGVAESLLSRRRLAELLRLVLSEQSLESVLARIARSLDELIGCDAVVIWENLGDELRPLHAYGRDAELMRTVRVVHGEGITGLAAATREPVLANDAHLDPRSVQIPGTPVEPESIVAIPLVARDQLIGALSMYRCGEGKPFPDADFELAEEFATLAAIALDNVRAREHFEQLAGTDDLTGLANRRRFREELERELSRATRAGADVALLILDIDDFKLINDCYGHLVGDETLVETARELARRVRQSDLVARVGGDEFAVLLPDTTLEEAWQLAERISLPLRIGSRTVRLTIGSAATDTGTGDLYHDADALLLRAKRTNRVQAVRGGNAHSRRRQARRDATVESSASWLGPPRAATG